ncbi:terminase family protein [Roseibacillus persicicus]|uniref:phage terminase large subunit family protein n=1 Tax=Roseibacillus persicicus TaxID=454148 RepID=UPI00398B3C70
MGRAKVIPPEAILLPYQERWVKDPSRFKIAEKSRQIGWTWATGYGLVRRKSLKTAKLDAWISSRDDIQARLFLEDIRTFADILQAGAKYLGEQALDDGRHSSYVLRFANGLRAHSMSSNPDAQAGKRGDRVLDEFALHPDPRKLYAIAEPGLTWGGQLEIFSTHRGSNNYFNLLLEEAKEKGNPKGFSLHRVTLEDALNEGFLAKLQSKLPPGDERQEMDEAEYFDYVKSKSPDEESFLQEYMCVPANDGSAFLTYELIDANTWRGPGSWEIPLAECAGPLYLGVDVGRHHDLTVFWVLEKSGDRFLTRRLLTLKGKTFAEQEGVLYSLLDEPNISRCCIDASGIGLQFAERAQQKYRSKVEPVTFTAKVKEELAFPLRGAFEDHALKIPSDPKVISDLRSITKTTTAAGNIRFDADRGTNGHADRFWALALALHAGQTKTSNFRIASL